MTGRTHTPVDAPSTGIRDSLLSKPRVAGIRPAAQLLRQQERASCSVAQTRMSKETEHEGVMGRGAFLRISAVLLSAGGLATVASPDSASAIGELFEFKDQARFAQHATIQVPDMAAALKFYVQGVGMKVLRTRAGPQFCLLYTSPSPRD